MARKSINSVVLEMIEKVNHVLKCGICDDQIAVGIREGQCQVLESLLHATGNYKGYRYLEQDEVPKGCRPGIRRDIDDPWNVTGFFVNVDETRRQYFWLTIK